MKLKYIESPEKLLEHFEAYVKDAKETPYLKHVFVGKDGDSKLQKLERPLTWVGFECYLCKMDIISSLASYEANENKSYDAYIPIINMIKKYVERDQFEGAVAGVYNAAIIARKQGLAEKQEVKHDVYDVTLKLT